MDKSRAKKAIQIIGLFARLDQTFKKSTLPAHSKTTDRAMAIKKSELYSALWKSCDELRGGMDASPGQTH